MPSFFEWRYVVETSINGTDWTYSDSPYDDKDQAIAAAKESKAPNKRVKQYKVTVFQKDNGPLKETVHPNQDVSIVPTVSWFCLSHPDQTMKAYETSEPRCPVCRQTMFQGDGAEDLPGFGLTSRNLDE